MERERGSVSRPYSRYRYRYRYRYGHVRICIYIYIYTYIHTYIYTFVFDWGLGLTVMSHADKTDHELRPSAVARGVGSALPCPPHALQATREMAAGDSVQCKTSAFQGVLSRVGCAAEGVRKSARCQGPGCGGLRVSLEFLSLGGKVPGDVGAVFAASCSGSQDVTAGSATLAGCRSRRHPRKDFRSTLLVLAKVRRSFGARGHLGAAGLGARRGGGGGRNFSASLEACGKRFPCLRAVEFRHGGGPSLGCL